MSELRLYGQVKAGASRATPTPHRASFCLRDVLGPGGAVTPRGFSLPFLRHPRARAPLPAHPPTLYPSQVKPAATAWRKLAGFFHASNFYSEAEAQRRTLRGPGMPHHRHPMTGDEALAGLILLVTVITGLGYLAWVSL